MPSSREVRARQNRQKERVAAAIAERRASQRRRRTIGGVVGVILLVVVVAIGLAAGTNDNKNSVAVSPTSNGPTTSEAPTTSTTIFQPKQKPCVGLKDTLPKGSPAIPLLAEAAPTRLKMKDLKIGTGAVVPQGAKVTVNYVGIACSTGKIFDSSYSRNQTFDADLSGGVIPGWIEGIPGMKIGGERLLAIPSSLAYGTTGSGPNIGPNEALYFLVAAEKLA
jgi:peptidylprolyl isomerase